MNDFIEWFLEKGLSDDLLGFVILFLMCLTILVAIGLIALMTVATRGLPLLILFFAGWVYVIYCYRKDDK
mgnify:CR=1 FL=1